MRLDATALRYLATSCDINFNIVCSFQRKTWDLLFRVHREILLLDNSASYASLTGIPKKSRYDFNLIINVHVRV